MHPWEIYNGTLEQQVLALYVAAKDTNIDTALDNNTIHLLTSDGMDIDSDKLFARQAQAFVWLAPISKSYYHSLTNYFWFWIVQIKGQTPIKL